MQILVKILQNINKSFFSSFALIQKQPKHKRNSQTPVKNKRSMSKKSKILLFSANRQIRLSTILQIF
jgi:hypothetical protein